MFARTRRHTIAHLPLGRQQGVILLLIVLSMLAIAGTIFLAAVGKSRSGASAESIRAQFSSAVDLKQALLGYVLSAPISASYLRPGSLPLPDSLAVTASYNGQSDTKCLSTATNGLPAADNSTASQRCLGRWPWAAIPIDMPDAARDSAGVLQANDPNGGIPWLAVSANLVFLDSCLPVLNSDVSNMTYTAFACGSTTALPHPWLTVRGSNGEVITNRAAAVIILPGKMVTREGGYAQARASAAAPGNPVDYLDRISLPIGCSASCTGTYDNAGLNNEFIQLSSSLRYPDNAEDATKRGAVPFNDIVAYITIDELMQTIEKRVLAEMATSMRQFKLGSAVAGEYPGNAKLPWLMPIPSGTVFADEASLTTQPNTIFGAFPFMTSLLAARYRTNFDWSVPSAGLNEQMLLITTTNSPTTNLCVQIHAQGGGNNNRWMRNPLNGTLLSSASYAGIASNGNVGPLTTGSSLPAEGTCSWKGKDELSCKKTVTSTNYNFYLYSTQARCNNDTNRVNASLQVERAVTLRATCNGSSALPSYTFASSSDVSRWERSCSVDSMLSVIDVTDTISNTSFNRLPAKASVYSTGTSGSISMSKMRYHPIIGDWFFTNGWYAMAFAAISPNASTTPSTPSPNPCGAITTLSLGQQLDVPLVLALAGKSLVGQNRPSALIAAYLDGVNATAFQNAFNAPILPSSNCALENYSALLTSTPNTSTPNDSLIAVSP